MRQARPLLCAALVLAGCAGSSADNPDFCKVQVLGIEKANTGPAGVDYAYKVKGEAGSAAVVSLVARLGPDNFINGKGVEVGPGAFLAVVELKLTGPPPELLVLLEVGASRRCRASAALPR